MPLSIIPSKTPVVTSLTPKVDLLTWEPSSALFPNSSPNPIVLVPGWGAHPCYYGDLIAEILALGRSVVSVWPRSEQTRDQTSPAHFQALPDLVAVVRRASASGEVAVVAESLGASYLLATGLCRGNDRVAFVAPGLMLRPRQLLSPRGLGDLVRLVRGSGLPLEGWRVEHVSTNPRFLEIVETSHLVPPASSRAYVLLAVWAAARAAMRPRTGHHNLIIQGSADSLIHPLGARYLHWRLGTKHSELCLVTGAPHGLLWDERFGLQTARQITEYLVR
jgi:pimeloyl-ACP methyl ester carboxylesterase